MLFVIKYQDMIHVWLFFQTFEWVAHLQSRHWRLKKINEGGRNKMAAISQKIFFLCENSYTLIQISPNLFPVV